MLNIKLKSHVFVKQYGESQWTPPLEGTSFHRRNSSVERPRGILNLFVTCLQVQFKSHFASHIWVMLLTKVEANIPSQAPQGHSRPPPIGPIMSPNIEWLTIIYHLCLAGSAQKIWGKALKRNAFKKSVCMFVCACVRVYVHVCDCVCVRESETSTLRVQEN